MNNRKKIFLGLQKTWVSICTVFILPTIFTQVVSFASFIKGIQLVCKSNRYTPCINGLTAFRLGQQFKVDINVGVLQGAFPYQFWFSLHTDCFTSCHRRLLKCAYDYASGCSYNWTTTSRLATWSANHWLVINITKCVECSFYSKTISSAFPFSFLNGKALSREHTVEYIGVHFNSNMTWLSHIGTHICFYSQAESYERLKVSVMANRISLRCPSNLILLPKHFPWTA